MDDFESERALVSEFTPEERNQFAALMAKAEQKPTVQQVQPFLRDLAKRGKELGLDMEIDVDDEQELQNLLDGLWDEPV